MGFLLVASFIQFGFVVGIATMLLFLYFVTLNEKFYNWAHRFEIAEYLDKVKNETTGFEYLGSDEYDTHYYKHPVTGEDRWYSYPFFYDKCNKPLY